MADASRERNAAAVRRLMARHFAARAPRAAWAEPTTRRPDGTLRAEARRDEQWRLSGEMRHAAPRDESPRGKMRSRLAMAERVARHEAAVGADERARLQGPAPASKRAEAEAKAQRDAIVRYERSIPRRRVIGHYSHLTAAQADLHMAVPNAYTADQLVERRGGRWILQNPYRQQLLRGEPVMSRVMRGEFYEERREPKHTKAR